MPRMDVTSRYNEAYLGWLTLLWQSLEVVDQHCRHGILRMDSILRAKLECLQLEQAVARLAHSGAHAPS